MRYSFFLLVIALSIALVACNNRQQSSKDAIVSSRPKVAGNAQTLSALIPYLNGIWVDKNYVDGIERNHSPYAAFHYLRDVASFEISINNNTKDSLLCGYSLNNHEGSQFVLYESKGHADNSFKTNIADDKGLRYELSYELGKDTLLVLRGYNKNDEEISQRFYKKVLPRYLDNDIEKGTAYITNKVLISGDYNFIDPVLSKVLVTFQSDGKVYGLETKGIEKYYINTDFEAGPANDLDQISFDVYTNNQKDYLFKIAGDTLKIFNTAYSSDSSSLRLGNIKYQLVKKH